MSNSHYELTQHTVNLEHLESHRKMIEANYIKSLDLIEKEMDEIYRRIMGAKSSVKKELLTKQHSKMEDMIGKLDVEFASDKDELDEIIKETRERINILTEQINNEKNSLEYNIDQLRKYRDGGSCTMTQILEKVVNSLEILGEQKKKKKKSTSSS
jgi:BMFP domain-containing protein YqiC